MTPPGAVPEPAAALTQHAQFLRRLAGRLLRTGDGADDLVQETFVRAIVHPDAAATASRGWLATVLRNLWRDHASADAARRRRESAVAAGAAMAAAAHDDDPNGIDLLHAALRALPADYRRVVELRYYHDHGPAAIARQLGVPEGTVKARLHRALQLLRTDLRQRAGGDHELRALLVPLASVGGLSVHLAVAAAVGLAVGGWLLVAWPAGAGPGRPDVGVRGAVAAVVRDAHAPPPPTRHDDPPPVRAVAAAPTSALEGVVAAGVVPLPFAPVRVRAGSREQTVLADGAGAFRLEGPWPVECEVQVQLEVPASWVDPDAGRRAAGEVVVAPVAAELRITPPAERYAVAWPSRAALPSPAVPVWSAPQRVVRTDGARIQVAAPPIRTVHLRGPLPAGSAIRCVAVWTAGTHPDPLFAAVAPGAVAVPLHADAEHPGAFWCRAPQAAASLRLVVVADDLQVATAVPGAVPEVSWSLVPEPRGALQGRVHTVAGSPCGGVQVVLVPADGRPCGGYVATAGDGTFRADGVPPGLVALRIDGEGIRPWRSTVAVAAHTTGHCALPIERRPPLGAIAGSVRTTSGRTLPTCMVLLTSCDDGSVFRNGPLEWGAEGSGRFRFEDLPAGDYELRCTVFGPGAVGEPVRRVPAPAQGVDFVVDDDGPVAHVEFEFVDAGGAPVAADVAVRVASVDSETTAHGVGTVAIEVPAGAPCPWMAFGPGIGAVRGEDRFAAGSARRRVVVQPGWSTLLRTLDVTTYHAPVGVAVEADGVLLGATNRRGELLVDLRHAPSAFAFGGGFGIHSGLSHDSGLDVATGALRQLEADHVLPVYLHRD